MKKSVLTLLLLLVCSVHRSMAYEYFTIYFSDGTKSEAFYASDVESIAYSKTDLDGIEHDHWLVQEIQTVDSLYRYSLASIKYLDFKEVDIDNVIDDIAHAFTAITPIYARCKSVDDISQHLSEIKSVEGVEDAWISSQTLYVKIRDWETISFFYPPEDEPFDGIFAQEALSRSRVFAESEESGSSHHHYTDIKKVCVINQQYRDEKAAAEARRIVEESFYNLCKEWKFEVDSINAPSPVFFKDSICDYDYIFLMTHGQYNKESNLHWLFTGEELYVANKDGIVDKEALESKLRKRVKDEYEKKYGQINGTELSFFSHNEKRGESEVPVYYTVISEKWIASGSKFKQDGKAIIFNTACQSLMGNNNMAQAFFERGAGQYIGYDEIAHWGHVAGNGFFSGLLNGKSSYVSYLSIPKQFSDYTFDDKNRKMCIHTVLRRIENPKYKYDICITRPTTLEAGTISNGGGSKYVLNGEMDAYRPLCNFYVGKSYNDEVLKNTYGFLYSKNPDMTDAKKITVDIKSNDISNKHVKWKAEIEEQELQPNTTYYYRAYMNDGMYDCYGEIKQFTTTEHATAYYVYDYDAKTITFYYDGNCESRNGEPILYSSFPRSNVKKAVFDSSFANYYDNGENCYYWFGRCIKLTIIENLQFLNTSKMTTMCGMFNNCSSLTNLDLSGFDTSNVTDMNGMFQGCSSLTNLDLSGFDTSNVTDMSSMFWNCSSLTNLDISSFNTAEVTDMSYMFKGCSSLTNLDMSGLNAAKVTKMSHMFQGCSSLTYLILSGFITDEVRDMSYMFNGCSALTNLDLSGFNTAEVTDMISVFKGCSSLTNLDLSGFNTEKVPKWKMIEMFYNCSSLKTIYAENWTDQKTFTDLSYDSMFLGCDNLVGGKGTKIGWTFYGYDEEGHKQGYSCPWDRRAAHIDGGKDWPGLFTKK